MVEKMVIHIVVIGLRVCLLDGVVFVEIKCHNVFKTQLSIFVKLDELFVNANRSASCCKSQDKSFSFSILFLYLFFD